MGKKVILLTEDDLEEIVLNVLNEQNEKKISVNMEGTWDAGYHSVNKLPPQVMSNLQKQRQAIDDFIKNNMGSIIKFDIQVGESKVTNYDAENNRKLLKPGELAKMRGESIKKLFTDYYQGAVSKGNLKSIPEFKITPVIGGPDYDKSMYEENCGKNAGGKDSQKCKTFFEQYKPAQFVKITVEAIANYDCIANLTITVGYYEEKLKSGMSKHFCNRAIFDILINGVTIGRANLNNKAKITNGKVNHYNETKGWNPGPLFIKTNRIIDGPKRKVSNNIDLESYVNRKCSFKLNQKFAELVLKRKSNSLDIAIRGAVEDVHADIPYVTIYNGYEGNRKCVYAGFPSAKLERGSKQAVYIGSLDSCADKVIKGFENNECG